MRILMVSKFYWLLGGVERYVKELGHLLEQRGHQIIPFAMQDPRNEASPYADYFVTPIEFLESGRRSAPWAMAERVIYSREARRKMARLIQDTQPDVAHLHNIYHHISPSVLDALEEFGIPTLMTLHDYKLVCPAYTFWSNGAICERCDRGRFYHCALRRCSHGSLPASLLSAVEAYVHRLTRIYDHVDLFVSPSHFLRQKHIDHGLAPGRIMRVPNFINLKHYTPCFEHGGYFAYVGRLTPFKGVETLLEATARLKSPPPLLIVGDGPSRESLEKKARQLEIENARFLGHQTGAALQDLTARAMFIVVPSEWYENCPYAVLEALALGTPVVATDVGGVPELVKDGLNGMLVPAGNADALAAGLRRMLELADAGRLPEMGRAGRRCVEENHNEESHTTALSCAYTRAGAPPL